MADKKQKQKRRRPDSDDESELPFKNILKPDRVILETLKKLLLATTTASSSNSKPLTLSDLNLAATCREVTDLSLSSVQSTIETLILQITHSILSGNGFGFQVPSRASSNQLYVPELDRIVLKDKTTHYFSPESSSIITLIYCKNTTNNGRMMNYLMVSYVWRISLTPVAVHLL